MTTRTADIRALRYAFERHRAATADYYTKARAILSIGVEVTWDKAGYTHSGTVISHGFEDRFKVRNAKTGRDVWITVFDLLRAQPAATIPGPDKCSPRGVPFSGSDAMMQAWDIKSNPWPKNTPDHLDWIADWHRANADAFRGHVEG